VGFERFGFRRLGIGEDEVLGLGCFFGSLSLVVLGKGGLERREVELSFRVVFERCLEVL
jgi:hypothetical protein